MERHRICHRCNPGAGFTEIRMVTKPFKEFRRQWTVAVNEESSWELVGIPLIREKYTLLLFRLGWDPCGHDSPFPLWRVLLPRPQLSNRQWSRRRNGGISLNGRRCRRAFRRRWNGQALNCTETARTQGKTGSLGSEQGDPPPKPWNRRRKNRIRERRTKQKRFRFKI